MDAGSPEYVCRAGAADAQVGKLFRGACFFEYGGQEQSSTNPNAYDVLHTTIILTRWVAPQKGQVPARAVLGGVDETPGVNQGVPLFVCHGPYGNGVQPGKMIAGKCNIGFGGHEIELSNFEVAVGNGSWDRKGTAGALVGGYENNGPLYVCRFRFSAFRGPLINWNGMVSQLNQLRININQADRGEHPGKLLADGHCHVGYGGGERDSTGYELFYPQ